jgi:hypothetical protein
VRAREVNVGTYEALRGATVEGGEDIGEHLYRPAPLRLKARSDVTGELGDHVGLT